MIISVEIEKNDEVSHTLTFNPRSRKGKKISLHYGEVYLLARAISYPDIILCDDESVINIKNILNGICGINLRIKRTIEYIHFLFDTGYISAIDFETYFEQMMQYNLLNFRCPPKNAKDAVVLEILLAYMSKTATSYNKR
ncbi:MAG: hypothetical protein ACE5KE_02025 [Methanosarcinales archaeon]